MIMGMFDTVMVECPGCGAEAGFQSKGARHPLMRTFALADAPGDVLSDVNRHGPHTCECGEVFEVRVETVAIPVRTATVVSKRYCAICESEIPAKRLEALPETMVCVTCSEDIGGEHELEVRMGSTGKVGSLKLTGQTLQVKRVKKEFK